MKDEKRPGFYYDLHASEWRPERRSGVDRRDRQKPTKEQMERRRAFRRQADRERYETDHKVAIREALEDFAEEHDGHL